MLELFINDALHRIKDLYDRTEGKCILSFSGGKDSTVVAELYLMAKAKGLVGEIPLIFADTQVEYDAIYEFVEWFSKNKQEVEYIKPRMSFGAVLKEYGKPMLSKMKSDHMSTYQRNVHNDSLMDIVRVQNLILGINKNSGYLTHHKLANKHFHLIHPTFSIKISNKCCDYLKKYPFQDYYGAHNIEGFITGIRISEGGVRAMQYKTCTSIKKIKNKEIIHKMPIFDWTDEAIEEFIKKYNVKISKAYTEYGLERTGCIGCPYAKDVYKNLEVLYKHEPQKYKAVMHWLKDVYIQQEIELPFDEQYTKELEDSKETLQQQRYEMLCKYRPDIAHKWEPKH